MKLTLRQIAEAASGRIEGGAPTLCAEGVCTDSRADLSGKAFVALRGERFDGHDHVRDAALGGAVCAVVEAGAGLLAADAGLPLVIVPDTVLALADMARFVRGASSIPWIATTGSSGKTTTKEMIACAMSVSGDVLKAPKSFNNKIGVPLTILGLEKRHRSASVEIGSNARGEIDYLSGIVRPDIAVITNIGEAHLGRFGSLQGVAEEKSDILRHVAESGVAVLGSDSRMYDAVARAARSRVVTFGLGSTCDFRPDYIDAGADGSVSFSCRGIDVLVRSGGLAGLRNALASLAVASCAGVDLAGAAEALSCFEPADLRSVLTQARGATIYVDCYNANPSSFRAALQAWRMLPCRNRRWVIAGDMNELGEDAERLHVDLGRDIARAGAEIILAVGENADNILTGAIQAGMPDVSIKKAPSVDEAAAIALETVSEGDLVLIKASRALRLEGVVDRLRG